MSDAPIPSADSSLFAEKGVDRILLRSNDPAKRREEIRAGTVLRRAEGITPERIARARSLFASYISPLPPPLLEQEGVNAFAARIMNRRDDPIRIHFLDTTVMRQGEYRTGSFKDYAPIELYERVERGDIPREAHTVSTGNHALALANAVQRVNAVRNLHIQAIATMDKGACEHKKQNVRNKGGIVREYYVAFFEGEGIFIRCFNVCCRILTALHLLPLRPVRSYKQGEDLVARTIAHDPAVMRLPHDNDSIASGYAIMALEALEQLKQQGVDGTSCEEVCALVPLGSGGLMHGWLEIAAQCGGRVYGVSTPPATSVFQSLRVHEVLRVEVASDPAFKSDGILATTEPGAFRAICHMGEGALLVRDHDAFMATALLAAYGILVEPTSGLPLAALMLHTDLFAGCRHAVIPLSSRHIHAGHNEEMQPYVRDIPLIEEYFRERREDIAQNVVR